MVCCPAGNLLIDQGEAGFDIQATPDDRGLDQIELVGVVVEDEVRILG